ncbi:MAG: hypothetical protein U9R24_03465 [Thermodesulfobacteriota bacterium]|nr:hypothetical protein [Thermodesulfobacteriota bacterium]
MILPENARAINEEFDDIAYSLDERRIRLWCATKARSYNKTYGKGGFMAVHKATRVSRLTSHLGLKQIESKDKLEKSRIRKVKLDENIYETGRKITDKELQNVRIERSDFQGE